MGCCTKGGSSGSMQCVWKKNGCELNPLCSMRLLGALVMFGSVRKFGESGTGFCVQNLHEMEGERQLMNLTSKMSS